MIFLFYYFNATPKIQNCKQAAPVAHFAKRNTKFGGGKRGRGGHSFSPHPFFCPPRPSGLVLATPQARNQFRSKWVRALFKISHQSQLSPFWERIASRLRHSAFGLCALRKAIKSHGGQKEKEMDLSFSYLK